jgi:hypothetical protein
MWTGKIDMAARRQVTNKLRGQYRRASKADKGEILDRVVATTGMGRSTARRMLSGLRLADPAEQVDGRSVRPRVFSDDARALLEHVWALMGMPCSKYLVVMVELWLPLLTSVPPPRWWQLCRAGTAPLWPPDRRRAAAVAVGDLR